jgi:hypothetical protein
MTDTPRRPAALRERGEEQEQTSAPASSSGCALESVPTEGVCSGRPSEVAVALVELLPALPAEAITDLQALLAMRLDFVAPSVAREARIGLLLDLVVVSDGELPGTDTYEQAREHSQCRGETWPAASTLARAYNGWDRACRAAMRLYHLGGRARTPSDYHHGGRGEPYSRAEVLDAIICFRDSHDNTWPQRGEFFQWGTAQRKLARRAGAPDPRIPNAKQLKTVCGRFDQAVRAARALMTQRLS